MKHDSIYTLLFHLIHCPNIIVQTLDLNFCVWKTPFSCHGGRDLSRPRHQLRNDLVAFLPFPGPFALAHPATWAWAEASGLRLMMYKHVHVYIYIYNIYIYIYYDTYVYVKKCIHMQMCVHRWIHKLYSRGLVSDYLRRFSTICLFMPFLVNHRTSMVITLPIFDG